MGTTNASQISTTVDSMLATLNSGGSINTIMITGHTAYYNDDKAHSHDTASSLDLSMRRAKTIRNEMVNYLDTLNGSTSNTTLLKSKLLSATLHGAGLQPGFCDPKFLVEETKMSVIEARTTLPWVKILDRRARIDLK